MANVLVIGAFARRVTFWTNQVNFVCQLAIPPAAKGIVLHQTHVHVIEGTRLWRAPAFQSAPIHVNMANVLVQKNALVQKDSF